MEGKERERKKERRKERKKERKQEREREREREKENVKRRKERETTIRRETKERTPENVTLAGNLDHRLRSREEKKAIIGLEKKKEKKYFSLSLFLIEISLRFLNSSSFLLATFHKYSRNFFSFSSFFRSSAFICFVRQKLRNTCISSQK